MNWIKALSLIVLFYLLAIFQNSFLINFAWHKAYLNLVLLALIVLFFKKKREIKEGFLLSLFAGFFMDIFSSYFFGLAILLFFLIYLLIEKIKKYFLATSFWSFCIVLAVSLIFYYLVFFLFNIFKPHYFNIFEILYNFLIGIVIYFISKLIYVFAGQRFRK